MTRYRAAALYLAGTATVAAAVFPPIYFFWYPWALFEQAGGRELFQLIVGVGLVAGPLLVLIVFVPGKKGLAFDLAFIAFVQASTLAYGVHVLFESRPAYIVFVKDRYELVRANEIAEGDLAKAKPGPFATLPWTGPRIVGGRIPKDPDEQYRLMMSALAGTDIQHLPQHYVPYPEVKDQVLSRAEKIARLRELNPQRNAEIDRLVARHGGAEGGLRFLPLRAGHRADLATIVDAKSADVLDIAGLRPWEFK
jgi:hypothetical protein